MPVLSFPFHDIRRINLFKITPLVGKFLTYNVEIFMMLVF